MTDRVVHLRTRIKINCFPKLSRGIDVASGIDGNVSTALGLAALAEFSAPFLFGVAVARTIGADIVEPATISINVILAVLIAAITWNLLTWWLGLPSSSSHALIGGLAATILWEITRRVIVWYYKTYTFVNLIYGSFASVVVFLLGVEAVALIVLLGAQVIAELERVNEKIR